MRQLLISRAYPVVSKICDLKLPISKARAVYYMFTDMERHFKFALNEERKLIQEFNGEENLDGTVSFTSPEDFGKFQDAVEELNNSEIEWEHKVITLSESDIGDQKISASDIFSLEDFIAFE